MKRDSYNQVAESLPFDNTTNGYTADNVQDAIEEGVTNALETHIYTILMEHNGTVSDGTFLGYAANVPGDDTPVIIPRDCNFVGFTFSNSRDNADYTLNFRKNSTTATIFHTTSKTSVQFFNEILGTPESFTAGDQIYVEYIDDGTNAANVAVLLTFKADQI